MNPLLLISENKEFKYWAVEIILGQDEYEIFQLSEKGYGLKYYDSTSGVGHYKELGLFEEKPKLLGVYGEIPESIANEIFKGNMVVDLLAVMGYLLWENEIDLTKNKVAIIKTKK